MKIAIFANTYRPAVLSHLKVLMDFFSEKNVVLMLEHDLYDFVLAHENCCPDTIEIINDD